MRSERRLCEEVHVNLAYRWFCRLGLENQVPNHSTFSKNRHGRFRDCELFRFVFKSAVERCMDKGLIGGEGFAVDASIIKADAHRARGFPGKEGVGCSKVLDSAYDEQTYGTPHRSYPRWSTKRHNSREFVGIPERPSSAADKPRSRLVVSCSALLGVTAILI